MAKRVIGVKLTIERLEYLAGAVLLRAIPDIIQAVRAALIPCCYARGKDWRNEHRS